MRSALNEGATLEIRDGSDANARLITTVDVRNYTRPESVVTTGNNMYVVFKAKAKLKVELFLEITAGPHKVNTFLADGLHHGSKSHFQCRVYEFLTKFP